MLFERLSVAVFVVLALAATRANSADHYSADDLNIAFNRLYDHLYNSVGREGSQQDYLKAAKRIGWRLELGNYLSRAANIYVYLNEFENCNEKAIDYMWYVISGRPNGAPGHKVYMRRDGYGPKPKDFLDHLLGSTLIRAGDRCKSFLERWYRKSEARMKPKINEMLHKVITRQAISQQTVVDFGVDFARETLSDPSLRGKLLQMDDNQVVIFFKNYLNDNLLKPCKKFIAKMGSVLKRAHHFYPQYKNLFDEPSQDFADDLARYEECKTSLNKLDVFVDIESDHALEYVKKEKNPTSAHSKYLPH